MVLCFLPCPLLQFMDSTSHTAVSSSHTAEVQSSPGEVRHLPSWEFQNSKDLSACFHCYASPCSLLHLSSLMLLWICMICIARCKHFERFLHLNLVSSCSASKKALQSLPLPARITGVSQPPVSRGLGTSVKTSHIPYKSCLIFCYRAKKKKENKNWNKISEQFLLVRNRSAETSPSLLTVQGVSV